MTQSLQEIALEAEWLKLKAEVERLNTLLNEEIIRANVLERCVEEREAEIARLKAELEKRLKVVRCVECKVLEDDIESDESGGFCHYIRKYCSPEDFCSRGAEKARRGNERV